MEKTPDTQAAEIERSEAAAAYTAAYSGPISGDLIPAQYKLGAALVLIALAVPVFLQPNLVSAAKVLMFYFMLAVGSICLGIFFFQSWILDKLRLAEDIADMVQDEAIHAVLTAGKPAEESCQALIDAALAAGGKDNITVILAKYQIP